MPGQKITRDFGRKLTEYGEDEVFARYLQEGGVRPLLKNLPPEIGPMSTGVFYAWLKETPERIEKWRTVQAIQGNKWAEEGLEIVDGCDDGSVPKARLRSEYRRWMAEKFNRKQFGQPETQVNVAVGIGEEFLASLKKVEQWAKEKKRAEASQEAAQETAQEVDYEVVDDDEEC
jgi:hypothetical protein